MVPPYRQAFDRIRSEFLEMPGMQLTLQQAERLCGVNSDICERVLADLVSAGFLCTSSSGTFLRRSDTAAADVDLIET